MKNAQTPLKIRQISNLAYFKSEDCKGEVLTHLQAERPVEKTIPSLNQESLQCNDCTGVALLRLLMMIQMDSFGELALKLSFKYNQKISNKKQSITKTYSYVLIFK